MKLYKADRSLQGVLQIVIAEVDGCVRPGAGQ